MAGQEVAAVLSMASAEFLVLEGGVLEWMCLDSLRRGRSADSRRFDGLKAVKLSRGRKVDP
jgi:hypothetical protein